MLSIGDLARHTRVSVRMLRHYDALGLVTPEQVDEGTGYRWYAASQIGRVDSLLALKELGFTLEQCRTILDEEVSVEELRGMLRLRQIELAEQIATDSARLAEVGRRLRSIERGLTMTNGTLQIKALPALRLAQVSTEVNDITEISGLVGSLFDTLAQRLVDAGVPVTSRGIRTYYARPGGSKIDVAAGLPVGPDVGPVRGVEVVELPAEAMAAVVVHRGPVAEIADAWLTFDVGVQQRGLQSFGTSRQVYLETPEDSDMWVVELQCPVREGAGCSQE